MRRSFLLGVSILLFTACVPLAPASPTAEAPTVTPNLNATPTLTPFGPSEMTPTALPPTQAPTFSPTPAQTASPTPAPVLPSYILDVTMDYAGHSLTADENIRYQNATGEALSDLVLAVEPNLWKGCFVLEYLLVNGVAVDEEDLDLNAGGLTVPLAAPFAPGETLNLSLHFDLRLPPTSSYDIFGYNKAQTNLVNWYPFVVPYVPGQGWLLHRPGDVGEHLVYDETTFDLILRMADQDSENVLVAASAPAEQTADGWHYHLENVRTFALSFSPDYQTASTNVNGVTVTSYFFENERTQGQAVLENVAKALNTYENFFGLDPYPSLSIVESLFFDGMEYDGLFFLSRNFYRAYREEPISDLIDIAVHETAHQWWFGSVGNDQALEPWLDEALATYSERLFYEENYPEIKINNWEDFRIHAFGAGGWVDTDIYHGGNFRTYANAVYLNGAQFLQALRERMGDETFFAFLKDYAAQMAGQRASAMDFFRILRQHTSADFSDIISEYFQSSQLY